MNYVIKFKRFFVIFFALMALAGISAAQDSALPLPQDMSADSPAADAPAVGFSLVQPVNGNILTPLNGPNYEQYVTWHREANAKKYIIKFKDTQTGLVRVKFVDDVLQDTTEFFCDAYTCVFKAVSSAFVGSLVNGHEYKVWVIAKLNDGTRTATPKVKVIAQPVQAPVLLTPLHGEQVYVSNQTAFTWGNGLDADNYTLIVKDPQSGQTVFQASYKAADICYWFCLAPVDTTSLQLNHNYKWFVKANGIYGGKAKSGKSAFSLITILNEQ